MSSTNQLGTEKGTLVEKVHNLLGGHHGHSHENDTTGTTETGHHHGHHHQTGTNTSGLTGTDATTTSTRNTGSGYDNTSGAGLVSGNLGAERAPANSSGLGNSGTYDSTQATTGTHSGLGSGSSIGNTDQYNSTSGAGIYGTTDAPGPFSNTESNPGYSSNAGTRRDNVGNAFTEANTSTSSSTTQEHKSSLLNKLDPRVNTDNTSTTGSSTTNTSRAYDDNNIASAKPGNSHASAGSARDDTSSNYNPQGQGQFHKDLKTMSGSTAGVSEGYSMSSAPTRDQEIQGASYGSAAVPETTAGLKTAGAEELTHERGEVGGSIGRAAGTGENW